jgi:hypothetical protein
MTFTLLMLGGTIVLMAVFAVATHVHETVNPMLAGETTMVGLADPASDTLAGHHATTPPPVGEMGEWSLRTVSALRDAEELLDCLEAQGYKERELVILGKSSFAVRWR